MLGTETDLILIDLVIGRALNFGYAENAMRDALTHMDRMMPDSTVQEKSRRFLVVSGVELGIDRSRKIKGSKNRMVETIYCERLDRCGKHFSSNY